MSFIGNIFNRKEVDDLSKDVESLSFTESPKRGQDAMSITSNSNSPSRSPINKENRRYGATPPFSTRLDREFYTKANSPKTKRLVTVCQMYFLDYYCDMFDYVITRRQRVGQVEAKLSNANISENEKGAIWSDYTLRERAFLRKRRTKPKNKDFNIITQVGQGGYGQVFLARKKDTKEICALKVLNKRLLSRTDETRHVLTERDILTNTRSEWLVKLYYAFQDSESVYMAMEFVPGGDFRTLLNNAGCLIPQHARFYISEMFAAVNSLHELGYTHRDLKPENFLIDARGHIKLTDFGLAAGTVSNDRIESMKLRLNQVKDLEFSQIDRSVSERQRLYKSLRSNDIHYANSVVGSPDYMALEVLEGKPYDYTVDYWSLGCMLFEAILSYTPFSGQSSDETYSNLKRWKQVLRCPRYDDGKPVFSDRTWQLITRLIASPNERLRSFKQVMSQPYFAEVDWDNIRKTVPPFTPQLDDEEDAGYFDDFTNEADMAKYKDVMAKRAHDEQMANGTIGVGKFVGFTFKHRDGKNVGKDGIMESFMIDLDSKNTKPFDTLY